LTHAVVLVHREPVPLQNGGGVGDAYAVNVLASAVHPRGVHFIARRPRLVAWRSHRGGSLPRVHFIEPSHPPQEPIMTNRTDTLIQRATAFALAAVMTLAVLGGIDTLARNDLAADALLAQQASAHRA
jgi:hypothetical protein